MAFSIKNDEADRLLREITALTGESLTTAVIESLRERLAREQRRTLATRRERVRRRVERYRALVAADPPGDPVLEWDEHGLPA